MEGYDTNLLGVSALPGSWPESRIVDLRHLPHLVVLCLPTV